MFCCVRIWPGILSAGNLLKNGFGTLAEMAAPFSYPIRGST